jgi:hypothetical protein
MNYQKPTSARFLPLGFLLVCGLFSVIQLRNAAEWQAAEAQQRAQFCTVDDPIVAIITAQASTWLEHFRTASTVITFTTAAGDPYTVEPLPAPLPGFIIPTVFDPPHSYYGERGFLYTLADPAQLDPANTYTPFAEHLYCFQRRHP